MTTLKSILYSFLIVGCFLLSSLAMVSCHNETFDCNDPDVDLFVEQLRSGKYASLNSEGLGIVPKFTTEDIGKLLEYADDLTLIPSFPLATVSYSPGGKLRLGECILGRWRPSAWGTMPPWDARWCTRMPTITRVFIS